MAIMLIQLLDNQVIIEGELKCLTIFQKNQLWDSKNQLKK
jgi:hypothetical protein